MLMVLACCFIIFSDIPLAASVVLLLLLAKVHNKDGLLIEALQGPLTFYSDGRVVFGLSPHTVKLPLFTCIEWALLLRIDKRWYVLWRDSVDPDAYRQLIVQMRREP